MEKKELSVLELIALKEYYEKIWREPCNPNRNSVKVIIDNIEKKLLKIVSSFKEVTNIPSQEEK